MGQMGHFIFGVGRSSLVSGPLLPTADFLWPAAYVEMIEREPPHPALAR
jgi:hypothetical protein